MKIFYYCLLLFLFTNTAASDVFAQDFGFGDVEDDSESGFFSGFSAGIGGEVSATLLGHLDDFYTSVGEANLGDIFAGKLNVTASAPNASAFISLKLAPVFDGSASPIAIDEGYVSGFFGKFTVEGGLRKLTWGKADSFGPLDIINPLDYSDLTDLSDIMGRKIARPLVRAAFAFGSFSKIEGVFVPAFQGHRFAAHGRWTPAQLKSYETSLRAGVASLMPGIIAGIESSGLPAEEKILLKIQAREKYSSLSFADFSPDTTGLKYAQAGLRFTSTIGSSDFGVQYYYGRFFRPAALVMGFDQAQPLPNPVVFVEYNRFHHIGVDYAQVIAGFNTRAEFAANITEDLAGDNGSVENPALLWSLGFDRALIGGVNVNIQANESIRLMNDKVNADPMLDIEAGRDVTSTRITLILSKKFLRDEFEVKATGLWGVEDKDFLITPAFIWTRNGLTAELSGGFFLGDEKGELGQYHKNNFIKTALTYSF